MENSGESAQYGRTGIRISTGEVYKKSCKNKRPRKNKAWLERTITDTSLPADNTNAIADDDLIIEQQAIQELAYSNKFTYKITRMPKVREEVVL